MFFTFLFHFISSLVSDKKQFLSIDNESDCIFDQEISESIISNNAICLINCSFRSIKSTSDGGAVIISLRNRFRIHNYIFNCTFTECKSNRGGAIFFNLEENCNSEILNSKFVNNVAISTSGGAIYTISEITNIFNITDCSFTENFASESGGCIYLSNINITFQKCEFMKSNVSAIFFEKSNGKFNLCSFSNNYKYTKYENKGGAIVFSNSFGSVLECNFTNNANGDSKGGAISNKWSTCNCKKCIFVNNTAPSGGAISYDYYVGLIDNCIFYNNTSYSQGGAISILYPSSNSSFNNCIFCNNSASSQKEETCGGAISILLRRSIYFLTNSFKNCTFSNNIAYSKSSTSFGGAVSIIYPEKIDSSRIFQVNDYFDDIKFINNTAFSHSFSSGGALSFNNKLTKYLIQLQGTLRNCIFMNNTTYSSIASFGGACSYNITFGDIFIYESKRFFENSTFINNRAISGKSNSYGGSISLSSSGYCRMESKVNFTFNNCTFNNNQVCSNSSSYGGAFSCSYNSKNLISRIWFEKTSFINNLAHSNSSFSNGGAVFISTSTGWFHDCFFNNNIAKTFLNITLITGKEPQSLGGAVNLKSSTYNFSVCYFINNTGFGNSLKHISSGKGGAVYSSLCNIDFYQCEFVNNTLYNIGLKFDIDCYIEGGACYFANTSSSLHNCIFNNNNASLYALEHTDFFSARIYGGAIFSHNLNEYFNCTNCIFSNNSVKVENHEEKEFAGSIFLTNGILINCSFENNNAYNGADIRYDQNKKSLLKISQCNFNSNDIKYHSKSLIHFRVNSNISSSNIFSYNKIMINASSFLFDGKLEVETSKLKFLFIRNCMTPFDENIYKSDEISIYSENENDQETFQSAFESSCSDYTISQTIPIITQTIPLKSPTASLSQTPKATNTKTPMKTKTNSITKSSIFTPTFTPTKTAMRTKTMIPTITPTKTASQSLPTITDTKTNTVSIITHTKEIVTPTKSISVTDNNNNNEYKKEFRMFFVLLMSILAFQIIIILLLIALLISSLIRKRRENNIIDHSLLDSMT